MKSKKLVYFAAIYNNKIAFMYIIMRKFKGEITGLLVATFVIVTFNGCQDGGNEYIPFVKFGQVTEFTREDYHTYMAYGDMYGRISQYVYQVGQNVISNSNVVYTSSGFTCLIDSFMYDVILTITTGGARASSMSVYSGNAIYFYVEYQYDEIGRLHLAKLIRPGDSNGKGSEIWISYTYTENSITIKEGQAFYEISLSDTEENTEYVCNIFAFSDAPLTTTYIINPELYFLNIYGMPIGKLPAGQAVDRVSNTDLRLSRVGKYYYKY